MPASVSVGVGDRFLNMGGSQHRRLVQSDREAQGFKRRKLGSHSAGSAQHDGCDCKRERVLQDDPPFLIAVPCRSRLSL